MVFPLYNTLCTCQSIWKFYFQIVVARPSRANLVSKTSKGKTILIKSVSEMQDLDIPFILMKIWSKSAKNT